jgi:hypothetical protein
MDDPRKTAYEPPPWVALVVGMIAGAALFASGMAFMKLLGG